MGRTKAPAKNADGKPSEMKALKEAYDEWIADAGEELIERAIERFGGPGRYSDRNCCLIVMQCPGAKDVRGFGAWLKEGRCVRKGQHAIAIIQPAGKSGGEEIPEGEAPKPDQAPEGDEKAKGRQRFKVGRVFDISQTDLLPPKATD